MVERDPTIIHLVDLSQLPLNYIQETKGSVLVGATTTIRQIELSPIFRRPPLNILYDAVSEFATVQVRNMASLGGNLCNGIPSADTPPPLIALDALIAVSGPQGPQVFPLEKLYRDVRRLSIRKGEVLTEVRIPRHVPKTSGAYLKLGRSQVDLALVSAAVRITLGDGGRAGGCRIVLGAVAPTPLRARNAEKFLTGRPIDEETVVEAGRVASLEARPISDIRASADYRREMVAVLVERAIRVAVSRLGTVLD